MKQVMKKLCVLLTLMTLSVGAWADDYYLSTDTWFSNDASKTQNVLKINLCKEGGGALQSAIDVITADGWTLNDHSLSDFKEVYIDLGSTNGTPIDAYAMNDADIAALSNLNFETIDLQNAYYKKDGEKSAFTFTNSHVQNLILPDNWTKEEVNTCAKSVGTSLGAAISQCPIDDSSATVYAYVCKPGTLVNTTDHVWFDNKANSKIGNLNMYNQSFNKVKNLSVSGYGSARDFSGVHGGLEYDANGHFIFDKAADETSDNRHAAVGGGTRTLIGGPEKLPGAWYGASLVTLDLENLIIEDEFNDDLNLSYGGLLGAETKRVIIPTYSGFHTLPADFLNVNGNQVRQICIPGNITTIRTRAFMNTPLYHVWTTVGDDPVVTHEGEDVTKYDNGIWMKEQREEYAAMDANEKVMPEGVYGYQDLSLTTTDYWYGTYTLPAGLELIESRAFANTQTFIKDVYCLSIKAPECHVDAFSTGGYIANNSMNGEPVDGIITRDAYAKDVIAGTWITMLHYPRESTTPDIQRYTDVTRDYSIATGLRDGKGATIYFPTQDEFNRAYLQGSTGYLWNAWDPTRDSNNSIDYLGINTLEQYNQGLQQKANDGYLNNDAEGIDKTDRSFYDVTVNNNLDQPVGLKPYYETIWEGKQLYPQVETEGTGTYRWTEDLDVNGNRQYEVDNDTPGDYIKVGTYSLATGTLNPSTTYYVRDYVGTGEYETTNTPNGSETYYSDAAGTTPVTPRVGAGFYYECGTQNVYSDAVYAPVDGVDTYYTKNGDEYTQANIQFWNTMYYNPQEDTRTSYISTQKIVSGFDTYYTSESGETIAEPTFVNNLWGNAITIYYKDGDTYFPTTSFKTGVTQYFVKYSWSGPEQYEDQTSNLQFTSTVYYPQTKTGVFFESTNYWLPEYPNPSDYYTSEDLNQKVTSFGGHNIQGTYYYAVGTAPKYCSAEGEDYDETVTYYTDNTGTTEATSITFDQAYYYEKSTYAYRAATDADADKKHYSLTESYAAKETVLNEPDEYRADEDLYSVKMKQVEIQSVTKSYDYRGWHQFVLTGYAANSTVPMVPYRSYISDNDWWTICLPFDLTRAEMIKFFGTEGGARLPYLSKLTYVVRDVENKDITLNFSKNLLEYKEELVGDSELHGKVSDTAGGVQDDDIVLHKGVPYLIRPFLTADAEGSIKRQFDIQSTNTEGDLYDRIKTSQELSGSDLNEIIYNGEYTVPAYVINNTSSLETVNTSDAVTFTMGDNTVFEYDNKEAKITYNGEEVDAQISSDYCYTFVGSFFLSLMPKYSYFLGWDSKKGKAAFWYNAVPNTTEWTWNNETGIILPNFVTAEQEIKITAATNLNNPARWVINLKNGDDFPKTTSVKNHVTAMDFGGSAKLFDSEATVIIKVDNDVIDPSSIHFNNKGVYSLSGQYMGNSVDGLQKGIYIVNGKKMVIK